MIRFIRIQFGLLVMAAAGLAAITAAPTASGLARADEKKLGKDVATWKEIFTEKELHSLVKLYVDELKSKTVKTKGQFNSGYKKAMQVGHALAALGNAGTLILEKEEVKAAAALREAGLEFAKASKEKNYAEAKAAFAKIESFPKEITPAESADTAKWSEVIPLVVLMENVNRIDSEMKKSFKQEADFKKSSKELSLRTKLLAAFAVIAHDEKDKADWQGWCDDMRKGSMEISKQFAAKSQSGAKAANEVLQKSCTECHNVYQDKDKN